MLRIHLLGSILLSKVSPSQLESTIRKCRSVQNIKKLNVDATLRHQQRRQRQDLVRPFGAAGRSLAQQYANESLALMTFDIPGTLQSDGLSRPGL